MQNNNLRNWNLLEGIDRIKMAKGGIVVNRLFCFVTGLHSHILKFFLKPKSQSVHKSQSIKQTRSAKSIQKLKDRKQYKTHNFQTVQIRKDPRQSKAKNQ